MNTEESRLIMIKMRFEGVPVESTFSNGLRKSTFEIVLQDDLVEICNVNGSRSPAFDDVWEAFQTFFDTLGMEISEDAPANVETVKTAIGALYLGIDGHYIGRSSDGRFSFRGKKTMPIGIVKQLLYPLDEILTSEGY